VWHASAVTWIDDFAAQLDVDPLSPEERRLLLDLAREVAHRTERVNAPLASYLVGRYMGGDAGGPEDIREAARRAASSMPPPTDATGGR
jgi:hypothetical protein